MKAGAGTKAGKEKKAAIMAAAERLFAERGVAATSTRDIARELGIGDASLYRHFPSKEVLVAELFADGYREYGRLLRAAADGKRGGRARLSAMVREVCRLADEDAARFTFLLLAQHGGLPTVEVGTDSPVDAVRACLAEALPEADAELAAAVAIGVVLQAATFRAYGRIARPMSELAPTLADAAWAAACACVARTPE
ncbi:helix-turn-helix domain-containing protein [Arenibaculum sp.]|jgi:AcrR family transcriptional regulator|uniref:TetR/AcrR family transcriptional regulator n=1 Tax=Arenibaculum sp. TaxID=2865862 RepID=UPI002E0DF776|nr:helix-turn-helix domain-containing protein [Arenibaculum sp.]